MREIRRAAGNLVTDMRAFQKLTPSADATDPAACGRTVFARARLVLPGEVVMGSLVVEDGRIAAIDTGGSRPAGAVDCEGDLLAPALVELHTDNLERHIEPRPGVRWPLRPAVVAHDAELAAVGIGTAFAALRVGSLLGAGDGEPRGPGTSDYGRHARPVTDVVAGLARDGALRVGHFVHLRAEICSETLADEMAEFAPADRVRLVSLMDHTPGERQFRDLDGVRAHLRARYGMNDAEVDARFRRLAELRARRAGAHEAEIVAHAARLGAALASHDDASEAHVARSAALGVTLAEFPTTLEAARACRARGIAVAMGAPNLLRGRSHSGNVRAEALVEEGLLDVLSSDYAPSSLLGGAVRLGELAGDMAAGFAAVTARPAEAGGLADRGRLAPGLRADLVRVRLDGIASRVVEHWRSGRRIA
ncbi:MAG TPA: alpha-D-ribose 1-methylphosphonate 5-triphosphate diphosphatase [Thermohalobaculum sp.]|nr:alpha-D-ribose 1-methylphosphonate 5-triphosphate diphosphatase [Thermohalobaculum sp.]